MTNFLLLFAFGVTQSFPVTASEHRSAQLFYCNIPRCADNVTHVFCNDEQLLSVIPIPHCTGPPPPNTVCQHDGRAFVSIDANGECEFEGKDGYITTEKLTDHGIWASNVTKSPRVPTVDHARHRYIVAGICCCFVLLIGILMGLHVYRVCENQRNGVLNQQPASDSGLAEPLREMQSPGETSESVARGGGPELDDDSSPSQCHNGA